MTRSADTVAFARWLMDHDPAKERIVIEQFGTDLLAFHGAGDSEPLRICAFYADAEGVSWQSLTECLFAAAHSYASRRPL